MENAYPKRIFRPGDEPQVKQINNSCKMTRFKRVKKALPSEYKEVREDPVFAPILRLCDTGLGYSARLIHSLMSRQLACKKKREIWCVFASRPLRFSLQEFAAVTGLSCTYENDVSSEEDNVVNDKGFWGALLKRKESICMQTLWSQENLKAAKKWKRIDRIRLIYIAVIAGLIMAKDEKAPIPNTYIRLVMDLNKVRSYPWGREGFTLLVNSIIKTRGNLKNKNSYVLDGFSYAFQIWAMEAIPHLGEFVAEKIKENSFDGPRCTNWKGLAKISYKDVIKLESKFLITDYVHPFISSTGNSDIVESAEHMWNDEVPDAAVDLLKAAIRKKKDFGDHIWECLEPADSFEASEEAEEEAEDDSLEGAEATENEASEESENVASDDIDVSIINKKRKRSGYGSEARKTNLLWQRATASQGIDDNMKATFEGMLEAACTSLEEKLVKKIDAGFEKLEKLIATRNVEPTSTPDVSNSKNAQPQERDEKNEAPALFDLNLDDMFGSNIYDTDHDLSTQEHFQKHLGHLSQDTTVTGFPTQTFVEKPTNIALTPQSFVSEGNLLRRVKIEIPELKDGDNKVDACFPLAYVSDDMWEQFLEWSEKHESLKFGSSVLDYVLFDRLIRKKEWLMSYEIDAVMYLFRENTTLGRWKHNRVAFMDTLFTQRIRRIYSDFKKAGQTYKWEGYSIDYGNGDLPCHGKTGLKWGVDVDRIYAPLNVNENHWISFCINLIRRTIEVFDCGNADNARQVEPFRVVIPRIVKAVQTPANAKQLYLTPYTIIKTHVKSGINRSGCDCGAFAVKFIECHLQGYDMSLLDDGNIMAARQRIAYDLWQGATDPILAERVANYVPTKIESEVIAIP